MNDVTTTKTGFRVSDVTLRNPRRQSEVAREIAAERGQDVSGTSVIAPVSLRGRGRPRGLCPHGLFPQLPKEYSTLPEVVRISSWFGADAEPDRPA